MDELFQHPIIRELWEDDPKPSYIPASFLGWITKAIGLLVTALAVSFRTPFWFDMLNKIMLVRGVGRSPDEKKAKEGASG